ncbi:MAG: RNA polymerase sigma factor RpoD, partial [Maritimibacter sp.]|nr:RNA polymerase sigma factor RpoD [Maritimibacter sp.]
MAVKESDDTKDTNEEDEPVSSDMDQAAIKKMIAEARDKGYITYDQLNNVLPPDTVSSEQIEDVMSMLSEMGINIIEDEEADDSEDEPKGSTEVVTTGSASREVALGGAEAEKLDRTDDP